MTQPICIYCGKTQQQHSAFNYCNNLLTKFTPPVISTDHTTPYSEPTKYGNFNFTPEKEPAVEEKSKKPSYILNSWVQAGILKTNSGYPEDDLWTVISWIDKAEHDSEKLREDKQELVEGLKLMVSKRKPLAHLSGCPVLTKTERIMTELMETEYNEENNNHHQISDAVNKNAVCNCGYDKAKQLIEKHGK